MTKIEMEKIDRLEHHFKIYKEDMDDVINSVSNIENKQLLARELADSIKWFQRGALGVLFAYITWLITK